MQPRSKQKRFSSDWFLALSAYLVLTTFVVSQSVYELLAANPEFLAVRGVGNAGLLEVILVFNLLPVLVLFVFWWLLRQAHAVLARGFLGVSVAGLFFAFFLPLYNAYVVYADWWLTFRFAVWDRLAAVSPYWLGLIPAALLGYACLRIEGQFRFFLLILSPVVLLFPGLFLARTWASESPANVQEAGPRTVARAGTGEMPPVFLLVFDELTLPALLNESGQIDEERFPHFDALAEDSYWFRTATANADHTTRSIAVLLTGNFPQGYDASYKAYPNNLFALLPAGYEVYVYEAYTHFCNPRRFHCPEREIARRRPELFRDVFYLYLARVLPKGTKVALPEMTRSWGPFLEDREAVASRVERFDNFLASLDFGVTDRVFVYFHHLLPHSPFLLTPEGDIVESEARQFPEQGPVSREVLDRYVAQIRFVDKELGRFVARLKELGLYERSLVVVTADHGVSYDSRAPGRFLEQGADAALLLRVPLFIKLPYQEQGVVSDREVQLIDVAPTVADIVRLRTAWPHTGRSVFLESAPQRPKVAYDRRNRRYEFSPRLGLDTLP